MRKEQDLLLRKAEESVRATLVLSPRDAGGRGDLEL